VRLAIFSQSGLVFPQFLVFETIFEACGKFFRVLKTLFGPFIVLKTNVSMPWFQYKIDLKNEPSRAEIFEKNKIGLRFGFACHVYNFFYKYLGNQNLLSYTILVHWTEL